MEDVAQLPAAPLLELIDATVRARGGATLLDRVSLRLERGEHVALLGPNGSGKTTLVRLIDRELYPLSRPDGPPPMRLFGQARWDVFALRRRLGLVTPAIERFFIDAQVPVWEAVVSGFHASRGLWTNHPVDDAQRARAHDLLAELAADHLAERRCATLSTGELRRVLIARALVHDPEALLLDEPTSGLDVVAAEYFLRALRRLAQAGKTLVLVTHRVEELVPEIERVVLLRAGRVLADGPVATTLTSERLSQAFGAPLRLTQRNGRHVVRLDPADE